MYNKESIISIDAKRNSGGGYVLTFLRTLRRCHYTSNHFLRIYYRWRLKKYRLCYGLEIPWDTKIGKGLYLGHAFNITINKDAVIGDFCNIHKGVVIGRENRGKRKGCPVIGNKVWIGINAAIVGAITIGDDVLIAPNAFVNVDVPSHSIVYGNPCVIKSCDNATEGYINDIE